MSMEPSKFQLQGFKVYIEEENLRDIIDSENIECSSILKSECPVVAEGKWSESGKWIFYKTHSEKTEYDFRFEEFMEQFKQGLEFFD